MTASKDDFHFWQRPSFNLLSQAQLDHIYAAALEVLARVGGEFHDPAAVALLADAGARVDADRRVRIPDTLVADALQKAPPQIVVHDRNGQPRLFLEDRNTHKPLIVTAWDLAGLHNIHRMMEMVAGDAATLRSRPFVVVFLMAISPYYSRFRVSRQRYDLFAGLAGHLQ